MVEFFSLASHAAQTLGIERWALDLPRVGGAVDADALWVDPRFIEICRQRDAVARQLSRRRHEVTINIDKRAKAIIKLEWQHALAQRQRLAQRQERATAAVSRGNRAATAPPPIYEVPTQASGRNRSVLVTSTTFGVQIIEFGPISPMNRVRRAGYL